MASFKTVAKSWLLIVPTAFMAVACANNSGTHDEAINPAIAVHPSNSASALAAAVVAGTVSIDSGENLELEATAATCPTYAQPGGAVCGGQANQIMTLAYSGCSFSGSTAIWNGGQTLAFVSPAACGTATFPLKDKESVVRGFVGTGDSATTCTTATGAVVKIDTQTSAGYSVAVNGGFRITGIGTGRSVVIQGIRLVLPGVWDVSVSSDADKPLVFDSVAKRTIKSGTVFVQHNLARFTGASEFSNVVFSATSCFPQSGAIVTTFRGSYSGTETLTFDGNGKATLTRPDGSKESFNLAYCF